LLRKLNWCYTALLVGLVGLSWLIVRSGIHLLNPDGSETVCYSCFGWSDEKVFEFGGVIFASLLLFRLMRWKKRISQMEMIVTLLCWFCVAILLLEMNVSSIILAVRMGNLILLAWMVCFLALAPVLIALRYTPKDELSLNIC